MTEKYTAKPGDWFLDSILKPMMKTWLWSKNVNIQPPYISYGTKYLYSKQAKTT